MKISIIGAGSFGTAMATVIARCGHEVMLWAHDHKVAYAMRSQRRNPTYLPEIALPDGVHVTNELGEAAEFSETVFMIVPSHHYRRVLTQLERHIERPVRVISGTKGIEIESLERMSDVTSFVLRDKMTTFATLSGPTFAVELARGDPTVAVVASADVSFAEELQRILSCGSFRLYNSADVVGVELAGSLKNVIAIAAGVLEGLGLGLNTTAALVTRGLHEITRLGLAHGGRPETFAGLAGMGDLLLTCTGGLSRNRSLGVALGHGRKLADILSETKSVAEGVKTAKAAKAIADKQGIEMPITTEMYRVLYEDASAREAIQRLMSRSLKAEAAR